MVLRSARRSALFSLLILVFSLPEYVSSQQVADSFGTTLSEFDEVYCKKLRDDLSLAAFEYMESGQIVDLNNYETIEAEEGASIFDINPNPAMAYDPSSAYCPADRMTREMNLLERFCGYTLADLKAVLLESGYWEEAAQIEIDFYAQYGYIPPQWS